MADLIGITECIRTLRRYGSRDKAADIQLVRYFVTANELIVKIKYKNCDLKCVIDKLSFADNEVLDVHSIDEFIEAYLRPLPPDFLVRIEGEEKGANVNITVSQD